MTQLLHITTQGPTPIFVTGTAVGGGGTASLSGNDTAGTITFRAAYSSTPTSCFLPSPTLPRARPCMSLEPPAASKCAPTRLPPAGAVLSFDYFVTQ
jgi:hypothetical protein